MYPDPSELDLLLGDPIKAMHKYFPYEAANDDPDALELVMEKYGGALNRRVAWDNHRFGCWVLVADLHAQATGKKLLPMLLEGQQAPPWIKKPWAFYNKLSLRFNSSASCPGKDYEGDIYLISP